MNLTAKSRNKRTIVSQICHAIYGLTSFRRGFCSLMIKTSRFPYIHWKSLMTILKIHQTFCIYFTVLRETYNYFEFSRCLSFLHNLPPLQGENVVSWTALNAVIPPAAVPAVGSERPTTPHFPSCLSNFLR